ncbi:MAG: glycoside hydrolase family 9 protein [Ignavibacteria bacterium]|nr:glycoside hydrolase family 9 protein [Ignavibacteria bacterium]
MKKYILFFTLFCAYGIYAAPGAIRVNLMGYLPRDYKTAVYLAETGHGNDKITIIDDETGLAEPVTIHCTSCGSFASFPEAIRINFSSLTRPGRYRITAGNVSSPVFAIGYDLYNGTADFLLRYMRQQRCGYNPFLKDSCHTKDGFIIYDSTRVGQHIDARGGWHDATDYLQYATTSATAIFHMLFAYQQNPSAFGDFYTAAGLPGSNGIPDILDEAKWGLNWLLRLNPNEGEYYHQIADDRDHRGFRLPNKDTVTYGPFPGRPVYRVTDQPQGLLKYQNRTTGSASIVAKFASSFSLGAQVLAPFCPGYADTLREKARAAYAYSKLHPGYCQTAPCVSPYFYEEENWVDDMELAAVQMYKLTADTTARNEAYNYALREPVSPWMGADTARHYQYYPFINLGHYYLAANSNGPERDSMLLFIKSALQKLSRRASHNPFRNGVPFIWCSNNLTSAEATLSRLYRIMTGDSAFIEIEFAARDWLLGCNPWGTSMICNLPVDMPTPTDPHSSLHVLNHYALDGGLVDGPVYNSIYQKLLGIQLHHPDEGKNFQSDLAVYHNDFGDYSTNEPTMDGTAGLTYIFSAIEAESRVTRALEKCTFESGALTRMDSTQQTIYLCFTGHEFDNAAETITRVLAKHSITASFFLTGDFYRNPAHEGTIRQLLAAGHYLGGHSGQHILYADWNKRDSLLVSRDSFFADIANNYRAMAPFGLNKITSPYFLPAYEWHNGTIGRWTGMAGLQLVNITPGWFTNADYTIPSMKSYKTSEAILDAVLRKEAQKPGALNGALLLMHIGTHPERTDLFCNSLDQLLTTLKERGYNFRSFTNIR